MQPFSQRLLFLGMMPNEMRMMAVSTLLFFYWPEITLPKMLGWKACFYDAESLACTKIWANKLS
jgi:hypothetical protein